MYHDWSVTALEALMSE